MLGVLLLLTLFTGSKALDVDPNGYILYCPCMGRFGNQADQFLGALSFGKALNRTLVLPPWVDYRSNPGKAGAIAFDTYFKVEPLQEFTKVMTMERFMKDLAPVIWPPAKRTVFCHSARHGGKPNDCNAKDGNPFGPFWSHFNIDFDKSEFYGSHLSTNTQDQQLSDKWNSRYPPTHHRVIAFTGTPGPFPAIEKDIANQQYIQWSREFDQKADEFIGNKLKRPFLGIHMRNGMDWSRACQHADGQARNMFSSANCLGYRLEHGKLTRDLCEPPKDVVVKQVKAAVKKLKTKHVFIATDNNDMISEFKVAMPKVTFVRLGENDPQLDLTILGRSDHYIGNCVSTFSAFAVRERKSANRTNEFWAFKSVLEREEL